MIKATNIFALILVVTVVAFIGFCVENIWLAFSKGFMDNRNMFLPFLLGYGIAMLLVYLLFGLPHRPLFFGIELQIENAVLRNVYYYVMMVICICIGEIALGKTVEKLCGIQWWNYSWIPLHITQYTSIPTSMGFAAIVFVFMRYAFDWLMQIFMSLSEFSRVLMGSYFGILLPADMIYHLYKMYKKHKTTTYWRIDFRKR